MTFLIKSFISPNFIVIELDPTFSTQSEKTHFAGMDVEYDFSTVLCLEHSVLTNSVVPVCWVQTNP